VVIQRKTGKGMKYTTRKKGRKREIQIKRGGMEDEDEVIRTEAVLISESLPTARH
jgi:hypothetical protein